MQLTRPPPPHGQGSDELYADSRLEAVDLGPGSIKQVLDAFPSQRPVPSLGGGIGYGAEGIDCWQVDGGFAEGCFVPVEDTGMLPPHRPHTPKDTSVQNMREGRCADARMSHRYGLSPKRLVNLACSG